MRSSERLLTWDGAMNGTMHSTWDRVTTYWATHCMEIIQMLYGVLTIGDMYVQR